MHTYTQQVCRVHEGGVLRGYIAHALLAIILFWRERFTVESPFLPQALRLKYVLPENFDDVGVPGTTTTIYNVLP
jgi:hypothetical protein